MVVQVFRCSGRSERLLRRDHQVLLVKDLDDETLDAIRNAGPSERSQGPTHPTDDTGTG
jgi:hypothetical protein